MRASICLAGAKAAAVGREFQSRISASQGLDHKPPVEPRHRLAGDGFHDLTAQGVSGPVILVRGAGAKRRINVGDYLLHVVESIAPVAGESGGVKIKIANGRRIGRMQPLQSRHIFGGRLVERDKPLIDELHHQNRTEKFGRRSQRRNRVGSVGRALVRSVGDIAPGAVEGDDAMPHDADRAANAGGCNPRRSVRLDAPPPGGRHVWLLPPASLPAVLPLVGPR